MPSPSDVSIIIPAYCAEEDSLGWLEECLASAVAQGGEVVVYDDGSPLDVLPVVGRYNVIFSKSDQNFGVSHARNQAVAKATKDLILPLDCDDFLIPNAVRKMLSIWDTTPIYPDVSKFGLESEPHYVLPDFSCEVLTRFVGFASVNVLHTKRQWESIGGWDEQLDFYEDGEYNARLFGTFCGVHFKEPLVYYRIHEHQRTKQYEKRSRGYALKILERIRRFDMACKSCGGGRRTQDLKAIGANAPMAARFASQGSSTPVPVQLANGVQTDLPLEFEGKVLAVYIGGEGKGRHYYNGYVSKTAYKLKYGDTLYADPRDVREPQQSGHPSLLVRVMRKLEPAPKVQVPVPTEVVRAVKAAAVEPEPVKLVEEVAEPAPEVVDLPDISNMTYDSILALDLDLETAKKLLVLEQHGLNRRKVTAHLLKLTKNE